MIECQTVAREAEARVQAVMQAAQAAVTVELESKAVLKETETAFRNAMSEINVLESQELDAESADRIRAEMFVFFSILKTEIAQGIGSQGQRCKNSRNIEVG